MDAWGQNTTNDKESSSGLLWTGTVLISIILPLSIYDESLIESVIRSYFININVESLNITYILLGVFVIFWFLYWQDTKVNANRKMLIGNMKRNIGDARKKFFEKIACPSARDCFDVEHCNITEKKDLPSKWYSFSKSKKIEIYGLSNKYEKYYEGTNFAGTIPDITQSEVEKIEQEGWQLLEIDEKIHESRNKPIFTKTFSYNSLKLTLVLLLVKIKFKCTGTYITKYMFVHCCVFISLSLSVFFVAFFGFV